MPTETEEMSCMNKELQRQSNIELLRILACYCVIVCHVAMYSGFSFPSWMSVNKLVVKMFYMFGELGVNLFILAFAYFMINSTSYKCKKIIKMIIQVLFYNLIIGFIAYKIGTYKINGIKSILLILFPTLFEQYWFFTAYVLVSVLSPYLNMLARSMDKECYKKFLVTILLIWCIIPTFFGIVDNSTETLLYYNRFIWFVIMYFVGGYIRIYGIARNAMKKSVALTGVSFLVIVCSILFIDKFDGFFATIGTTEVAYLWRPNSLLQLTFAIGVFGIFLNMKISYNAVINKIASATLGVYILHYSFLVYRFPWKDIFKGAQHQTEPYLAFRILVTSIIVMVVCAIIDLIRQILEKYTVQRVLDSKYISKKLKG